MNSKNNIRDRFDELFERYEVIYGKRLSQKELAEILCSMCENVIVHAMSIINFIIKFCRLQNNKNTI